MIPSLRLPGLSAAQARLLPEGRMAGPMPWVIAIMIFLTALAAATGMALSRSAASLQADLAGRVTVQVMEANPVRRAQEAAALEAGLARLAGVAAFRRVPEAEVAALLAPWFGADGLDRDLPVPLLIDVTLNPKLQGAMPALTHLVDDLAPAARVQPHGQWLGPLVGLMQALTWLAGVLVLMMAGAATAIVGLAARSALNTHRTTIEVMHLLGATDAQIARLFQRRIGLDALFGATIGLVAALMALALIGQRVAALGSELLGTATLGATGWLTLLALPLVTALVAVLTARLTILLTLRRWL